MVFAKDLDIKIEKEGRTMSRYYPYGVWCGKYFMWCDDVVDITEGENECSGDCKNCEYAEDIRNGEKR